MEVRVAEVPGSGDSKGGLRCWLSGGRAYLLVRVGTACERVVAEHGSGAVKVLKVWPGDEGCEPLLCAEVVPPQDYVVEVSLGDGVDNVVFRVFRAIDCGGKGFDVVGLIGECVPGPQPHTPR